MVNPKKKEQCSLCRAVEGGKNFNAILSKFHKHLLCDFCIDYWKRMEKRFHTKITIDKLKAGFTPGEFDRRKI